jgi:putative transcriptional regulator
MKKPVTLMIVLFLLAGGQWLAAAEASPYRDHADDGRLAPAPGRFLVSQRSLYHSWFSRTVIFLLQHDEDGTVGVIVNRPLDRQVHEALPDMQSTEIGTYPLYTGGPVNPRILVMLLKGDFDNSPAMQVSDGVYASSNREMLARMVNVCKPYNEMRMFLGQSTWQPGQLDREIGKNYWFVTAGDADAIFAGETEHLWEKLINRLDPAGILVLNFCHSHLCRNDSSDSLQGRLLDQYPGTGRDAVEQFDHVIIAHLHAAMR